MHQLVRSLILLIADVFRCYFFPDDSQEDEDGRVLNLVKTLEEAREQVDHDENDRNSEDSVDLKDDKITEKAHEDGEVTDDTKENTESLENQERSELGDESRKSSKAVSEDEVEKSEGEDAGNDENQRSGGGKTSREF